MYSILIDVRRVMAKKTHIHKEIKTHRYKALIHRHKDIDIKTLFFRHVGRHFQIRIHRYK